MVVMMPACSGSDEWHALGVLGTRVNDESQAVRSLCRMVVRGSSRRCRGAFWLRFTYVPPVVTKY
jgi:hypothetical protein